MGDAIMWRDKVNVNMFSLGLVVGGEIFTDIHVDLDGICELFGEDAFHAACKLTPGGEPVEVVLTLTFSAEAGR